MEKGGERIKLSCITKIQNIYSTYFEKDHIQLMTNYG